MHDMRWPLVLMLATTLVVGCDKSKTPAEGTEAAANLAAGDTAPDVDMTLHTGETIKLSSLRGSNVLLWFYPKDDTPG